MSGGDEAVKFWSTTSVSDGWSKLCHAGSGLAYRCTTRLEELSSATTSPAVLSVRHSTAPSWAVRTRLVSTASVAGRDQSPRLAGVARQTGTEDGRCTTARSSDAGPTRRKPRAKAALVAYSNGSNDAADLAACVAVKPLMSCVVSSSSPLAPSTGSTAGDPTQRRRRTTMAAAIAGSHLACLIVEKERMKVKC